MWAPCDIASTAFLRFVFGMTCLWHVGLYFYHDSIDYYFGGTPHHLTFFGFDWVRPLDLEGMRGVYYLMGLSAIGVAIGLFYRISSLTLFVTFTYALFAEASQFQNHYYLMCLLAFLFTWIPAHRSLSVDAVIAPGKASSFIPNWCRWLLMFQIGVPYFFGGIAKLNDDWLHAMPVGMWISERSDLPLIGPWLTEPSAAWFVSYTGLLLDLFIVPLLLWRKSRPWAFLVVLCFHLSNAVLFEIDVFPWMMIFATTVFFPSGWPRRIFRLRLPDVGLAKPNDSGRRLVAGVVSAYVAWQLLFPLRHFVYPGNPSWTEEGQQFAWRMMLRRKDIFLRIYATDGPSRRVVQLPLKNLMRYKQLIKMANSPDQLLACAPYFASAARKMGLRDVEIRAVVLTSLNGRRPQFQVDPALNLLSVQRSVWSQPGIMALTEQRRLVPWQHPTREWPELLQISLPDTSG